MKGVAAALARRIWPQVATLDDRQQGDLVAETVIALASLPILVLSTAWLVAGTNWEQWPAQWPFLLLLSVLGIVAGRIPYFQIVGREAGQYSYNSSDLVDVITLSGVLILGPIAIWAHLIGRIALFVSTLSRRDTPALQANWIRNLLYNLCYSIISLLAGFYVYRYLGGQVPLPDISASSLAAAFAFLIVKLLLSGVMLFLFLWQYWRVRGQEVRSVLVTGRSRVVSFFVLGDIPSVFGILGAAIYAQMSFGGYLFFVVAVLLTSFLARQQSQAAMLSQQRARQLEKLEELGRAFIELAADGEKLPDTLRDYVPRMFDYDRVEVRLFDGTVLLEIPERPVAYDARLWDWLKTMEQPAAFMKGDRLPWSEQISTEFFLLAPIRHPDTNRALGGICLRTSSRFTSLGFRESLPSLQVLAAQVASVLYRLESYRERLALERATQELALARQMQASFLPTELPHIPGWELGATLRPARQTSGDFYDILEVTGGRLALMIADVADKGMSAALFMALTRTLLRTYAADFPDDPARVLSAANRRLLSDSSDDSFVTIFYAVLDVDTGALCYANAGHNPPFIMSHDRPLPLPNTGMPLGIHEDAAWTVGEVDVAPGDLLLLFTDGIVDAHNMQDELFGEERLLQAVTVCRDAPVAQVQAAVMEAVRDFSGPRPQFDDLTLLLARRLAA